VEVPVLIEPVTENGYRAIGAGGLSLGLSAEGDTREEAMEKIRELVKARVARGAEIRPLQVPAGPHPWSAQAGWLRDDPMFDAWQQAIEEYRRQRDEDPDAL
jgi:hypothetical protein